jgi:hypothetical protein
MEESMRFCTLIVVTMLASIVTLVVLVWSEGTTIDPDLDGARAHAQAMWSHHLVEVVEGWKLVGLALMLLAWIGYRWAGMSKSWWRSSIQDCAATIIWFLCSGLIVLIGAAEFFSMVSAGFDAQVGHAQANSFTLLAASCLELTFPIGLGLVWASKEEGHSLLE